jgi:3',5'-cyclic AMP phosphodiesterase CpdA
MLLCQISDLHVKAGRRKAYGIVDTAAMLERCVERILALPQRPDAVVATGDLADHGRPDDYALLRELLAPLTMPLYLVAGNHDDRDAMRAAFPDHAYLREGGPFVQYAVDAHPLRIVALDTVIPGEGRGRLCAERLGWLDRTLAEQPERPTVIALHHPPFATGIGHMDRIALEGASGLASVVASHPQVERLVAGHLHRSITVRFAGTVAGTCPSPAHQVALDLAPDAADRFVMEPPGLQLHWWDGRALVTHTACVDAFEGPYPFREGGVLIDD